jgi:mercuric reductase
VTQTIEMKIAGMTCAHCEHTVEKTLSRVGASEPTADFRRGQATFRWPEGEDVQVAEKAVSNAGYRPHGFEVLRPTTESTRSTATSGGDYDLAILGSGSAAFAAAIRARDAGAKVVMVEEGTLGGTCVNVGCVPSKALLAAADLYYRAGHNPFAGVPTSTSPVDLRALVGRKDELVGALRKEKYADLVEEYGWTVLHGHTAFADADTLMIDGKRLRADRYLIATGSSPAVPPIPGLEEAGYLTSTTALELTELPTSMVVIGANAIGLEMGQLFLHLGTKVTFLEVVDRIAPFEEPEISDAFTEVLRGQGAEVLTGANIARVERRGAERVVYVEVAGQERVIQAAQVLVATGRRPNTEHLALDRAGVTTGARGAVAVDETLRTDNPKVWAAGDVTGAPQFVYVSAYQGTLAADNILNGNSRKVDLSALPRVTFTTPQIASVGMTEQEASQAGYEPKTSILPLTAVPRALVNQDTHGLFKLVADEITDKLLGVHILAENAGDVIYSGVLAIKFNLTVADITTTFDPYLTMAEGLKLAAQTFGKDVSKLSCCAA